MVEKQNPHVLFVKYDHDEVNFIPFVTAVSHRSNQTSPAVLPNESTVSKAKKDDLRFMCNQSIIPKDYNFCYSSLSIERKNATEATATPEEVGPASARSLRKRSWSPVRKGSAANRTGVLKLAAVLRSQDTV